MLRNLGFAILVAAIVLFGFLSAIIVSILKAIGDVL